jgi:uncharacterized protein (DUF983 family)
MALARADHNRLIYDWGARRIARGKCPYCRYGRLALNEDTGKRYTRCQACLDKMAEAYERRKARRTA